jgi:purine-binding chemotaxis protein CheW
METKLNSQENRYLAFSLGAENYAIPLLLVKEVVALPKIRALPQTPAHFLGLMDLRGQVMPVIDLRLKLNIKPSTSLETSVIICDLQSVCIAMVVDSINLVLAPLPSEISEQPSVEEGKRLEYITGVYRKDSNLILFLDPTKLLKLDGQIAAKVIPAQAA